MHKLSFLLAGAIAVTAFLGASATAAFAGTPGTSATTTVTGSVAEVVGWQSPPPATLSLGTLTPGQLSASQNIPWSLASNDGTQVTLAIINSGPSVPVTGGPLSGPGPFTGTNQGIDNGLYNSASWINSLTLSQGIGTAGVNYGWNIDGQQGIVPQGGSYTEAIIAANDTSTHNTAVAFLTPKAVFPDTVGATFTFTLIGS